MPLSETEAKLYQWVTDGKRQTLQSWTCPAGLEWGIGGTGRFIRAVRTNLLPGSAPFYTKPGGPLVDALEEARGLLSEGTCQFEIDARQWRVMSHVGSTSRLRMLVGWGERARLIEATNIDPPGLHPADLARAVCPNAVRFDERWYRKAHIVAPEHPESWVPKPWLVDWGIGFSYVMPRPLT